MMGVGSIAIWSWDRKRICKCPCLSGFVDNNLDLNVRFGVDWDEKIRRVYSYIVMDYLVEHNQSCS